MSLIDIEKYLERRTEELKLGLDQTLESLIQFDLPVDDPDRTQLIDMNGMDRIRLSEIERLKDEIAKMKTNQRSKGLKSAFE